MNTQWTHIVIFMAAVVSGVLNFDGFTELVAEIDWWHKSLFAMTAVVVTFSLSLFWQYAFSIIPELSTGRFRTQGWATVVAGVMIIVGLSTYWNVTSLTRGEIQRLSGNAVVERAGKFYTAALIRINSYQTYIPDIVSFEADTNALKLRELNGGSSGTPGSGPVSETIGQVGSRLNVLVKSINDVKSNLATLQTKATACLVDLRSASGSGDKELANKSVSCINQTLSEMAGMTPALAIKRGLTNLTSGIVVPVNVRTKVQREIITGFLGKAQSRADKIANDINANDKEDGVQTISLDRPNVMKSILIYWDSLIPPIATALAIDLLPLILLVFSVLRFDDQRALGAPRKIWTAAELEDALLQTKLLEKSLSDIRSIPDLPNYIDITPMPPSTNLKSPAQKDNDAGLDQEAAS